MNKKIAVAMSGGVDSSLTAAILLERGFEVFGVTMLLNDVATEFHDAEKVADKLGIFHFTADFREIFKREVEDYFVAEYLRGRTPNPCVRCNKKIKFGALFDFAKSHGADYLATGHYARIVFEDGRYKLKKGVDVKKDQSYVLYNLTAEMLPKIFLPLGDMSKVETRRLAEEMNLPVAHKPDSQEICFVPNDDYKNFISSRAGDADALKCGDIVDTEGKVLGRHNGVANYTIGQRKGLGIAAETPLYVVRLDVKKRQVVVGKSDEIFSSELTAENVHWIYKPKNFPVKLQAKIRYTPRIFDCVAESFGDNLRVKFFEPQRAVTSGQSIVFYDGDEVLGGGVIVT